MAPPRNINKVQKFTRQVAALNILLSGSTKNCLLLFKVLQKAQTWDDECNQAFEALKKYLTSPLLLS